jgi:hypothetical protein
MKGSAQCAPAAVPSVRLLSRRDALDPGVIRAAALAGLARFTQSEFGLGVGHHGAVGIREDADRHAASATAAGGAVCASPTVPTIASAAGAIASRTAYLSRLADGSVATVTGVISFDDAIGAHHDLRTSHQNGNASAAACAGLAAPASATSARTPTSSTVRSTGTAAATLTLRAVRTVYAAGRSPPRGAHRARVMGTLRIINDRRRRIAILTGTTRTARAHNSTNSPSVSVIGLPVTAGRGRNTGATDTAA